MNNFTIRLLKKSEQHLILPLLGDAFPDYWEQLALKQGKMPYEEISFAAFDGTDVVGHCGVIPYRIWCENSVVPMAGIASVAVAKEYRNRGIARELCTFAAQWAKQEKFVSLPLYTEHFRVYESASWQIFETPSARRVISGKKTAALSWEKGSGLTDREKENIIRLYKDSPLFNGKVLRDESDTLHSWERIFAEPEFRFAVVPKMYAIKTGDTVIEIAFDIPETSVADRKRLFYQLGVQKLFLPETEIVKELLAGVEFEEISPDDVMHGEKVMVLDIAENFHCGRNIFYPIVDKF